MRVSPVFQTRRNTRGLGAACATARFCYNYWKWKWERGKEKEQCCCLPLPTWKVPYLLFNRRDCLARRQLPNPAIILPAIRICGGRTKYSSHCCCEVLRPTRSPPVWASHLCVSHTRSSPRPQPCITSDPGLFSREFCLGGETVALLFHQFFACCITLPCTGVSDKALGSSLSRPVYLLHTHLAF